MVETWDVVIAGGAVMGSATAFFLANNPDFDGKILVIEKDPSYQTCSTALSAASIRQQFSTPENIRVSQFGVDFIKNIGTYLSTGDEPPEVNFVEGGYLLLASDKGSEVLRSNFAIQQAENSPLRLLAAAELKDRFPWLNVDDISLGCLGEQGEGWLDAYGLLQAFRKKAVSLGVSYQKAELVAIGLQGGRVTEVGLADGRTVQCGAFVNAAGARAAGVARMAGLQLPVESRKRFVFVFRCQDQLGHCPLVVDPEGIYFRPEGDGFICGMSPAEGEDDPECFDFDVDYALFEETIWPRLAHRVPAFEAIKLSNAWAGHYAYNTFDQNAILGPHPWLENFYFINGFSGHGLQQAPAMGRALAEKIVYGAYRSLDLGCFSFERLAANRPVKEINVI